MSQMPGNSKVINQKPWVNEKPFQALLKRRLVYSCNTMFFSALLILEHFLHGK